MVVPVGQSDAVQVMIKVTRTDSGFDYDELRQVRFVSLDRGYGSRVNGVINARSRKRLD